MPCPASLLAHREPIVIAAFAARWDVTAVEADALFEDAMAWLWISTQPGSPARTIDPALRIIDEMWHELVLHTACYRALCDRHFGRFVDHLPSPADDDGGDDAGLPNTGPAQWRFIGAELGVDRLLRWYVELPLRHDDAWFRAARRAQDFGYQPSPSLIATWQARRGTGA